MSAYLFDYYKEHLKNAESPVMPASWLSDRGIAGLLLNSGSHFIDLTFD